MTLFIRKDTPCTCFTILYNCITKMANINPIHTIYNISRSLFKQFAISYSKEILFKSGKTKSILATETPIASIDIKAGKRYLILGHTSVTNAHIELISATFLPVGSNDNVSIYGRTQSRTTGSNGGGCDTFIYVNCIHDTQITIAGYGYANSDYDYEGHILGIEL